MKLLLIITDYGSFNNFLSEIAVELVYAGNEVHVICSPLKIINYEDRYPFENIGIKIHYLYFPRSYNLLRQVIASKNINKKISEINPDLINIHFTTGIFTTLLWKKPACFIIGTIHGLGYPTMANRLKRELFKTIEHFCFRRLDRVCLINQYDYDLVNKIHPGKAIKYTSYGVGCNLDNFNVSAINTDFVQKLRANLRIKPNDFVLAFTGRFVSFKGFNILIKAMIALIQKDLIENVKLLLIGGDDPAHSNGLDEKELVCYKAMPEIIYVGFTPFVSRYLAIADVFVFPSTKEGMPVCVMEALAMGVPVITSNTRGCNDLVKHEYNGLLLSEKPTETEVKEAIIHLIQNPELLKLLSKNALLMRDELSRDSFVKSQMDIYNECLALSKES